MALWKINVENKLCIFFLLHNHVTLQMVGISLCNRPDISKLESTHNAFDKQNSWNYGATHVTIGYSLTLTMCDKLLWLKWNAVLFHIIFIKTPDENFSHRVTWLLVINKNGDARRAIADEGVIFLLVLKKIRLHLRNEGSGQVWMWYFSHMPETDEDSCLTK